MKDFIKVSNTELTVPSIAVGCMRIADMEVKDVRNLVDGALDMGLNFFDHADIYGGGRSEEIFSQAVEMKPSTREKMMLQSKCGIRKGFLTFPRSIYWNRWMAFSRG